jgi:putative transposase
VVKTDSNHGRKVYPNLAREMVLTGMDQLWRADITYIRLRDEFLYLAVILDAFSRRVIGWALDRTIEDSLTLNALQNGAGRTGRGAGAGPSFRPWFAVRQPRTVSSSACRVRAIRGTTPPANPFMKTLKYEEVHRIEYRDLAEARAEIREFPEKVYNRKRLHSELGYVPPAEFDAGLVARQKEAAARQLS